MRRLIIYLAKILISMACIMALVAFPAFLGGLTVGGTWSHVGAAAIAVAVCVAMCLFINRLETGRWL